MYKIKIILADSDEQYVDRVAKFINAKYQSRIKVSTFTRVDVFEKLMQSSHGNTDILVAHPEFLKNIKKLSENIKLIVLLSDGTIQDLNKSYEVINKYQPGDRLVSSLIEIYSKKNEMAAELIKGAQDTKILSVYSPAGGVGKTSIALGLAAKLSDLGQNVLCLSLESSSSLMAPLQCTGNSGLSHILLSIRENDATLPIKVEKYKSKDLLYNIEFIEPPDHYLELSDLSSEDLRKLYMRLQQIGKYDAVILDMDTVINEKIVTAFEYSDKIILVQCMEPLCMYKTENFFDQINKSGIAEKTGLFNKVIPVMNKFTDGSGFRQINDLGTEFGLKTKYCIPLFHNLWVYQNGRLTFDEGRRFIDGLCDLTRFLTKE